MGLKAGTFVKVNATCPWKHLVGMQGIVASVISSKDKIASQHAKMPDGSDKNFKDCVNHTLLGFYVKGMGVKSAEYLLADSMLDVVKNPEGNMPFKSMTKKEHEDEMRDKMKDMDPMQMLVQMMLRSR